MTNSMRSYTANKQLMQTSNYIIIAGVISLGTYWAWIFATYSATVINPFKNYGVDAYIPLLVIAASMSAVSMLAIAIFFRKIDGVFESIGAYIITAICSALSCIPAFLDSIGIEISYWLCVCLWIISAFFSSIVFMRTGFFLIWLHKAKLARCIALALLIASVVYTTATCLEPTVSVLLIMLMPIISCACSYIVKSRTPHLKGDKQGDELRSKEPVGSFKTYVGEALLFAPTGLIYAVPFGCVSCIVLLLASSHNMISVIALAIFVASLFAVVLAFVCNKDFEAGIIRKLLLPLIALSVLPFPYLNDYIRVPFLAIAVFVFVFFDAVTWGDLADEVRDRNVHSLGYMSTLTFTNFIGVALGWGVGYLIVKLMPVYSLGTMFGIASIVFVIVLIVDLVFDSKMNIMGGDVITTIEDKTAPKEEIIKAISKEYKLSKRESVIVEMLARGRNYKYIENQLVISGHTVKTHVYHIYKKLDIHSQQDLLDMVDEALGKK